MAKFRKLIPNYIFNNSWLIAGSIVLVTIIAILCVNYTSAHSGSSNTKPTVKAISKPQKDTVKNQQTETKQPETKEDTTTSTVPAVATKATSERPNSATSTQNSSPVSAPASTFTIDYLFLDQPSVFCSGGGDYYIAQIGDVNVGLHGANGGQISYGFEVTGGIPDTWAGYHATATISSGITSTSFNKLGAIGSGPHMAYSEVIWSGHGQAAIRAVIYSPNVVYSQWVSVPAQTAGEKCS